MLSNIDKDLCPLNDLSKLHLVSGLFVSFLELRMGADTKLKNDFYFSKNLKGS